MRRSKRPNLTRLLVVASIVLATAGTSVAAYTLSTSSSAEPAPRSATKLTEPMYVQLVHKRVPAFAASTRAQLSDLGRKECVVLGGSGGWRTASKIVANVGLTRWQASYFLALTIDVYCPQLHSAEPSDRESVA